MAADQAKRRKRDPKKVTALAAHLRAQIMSGELKDGDTIPSQAKLVAEHDVSEETARGAVDLLVSEALVHKRHGRPTLVTYRDPVHRLLLVPSGAQTERLKEAPAIFTSDPEATVGERVSFERPTEVPERFVGLLGLEPGRVMTERTIRQTVDGETVLTSISYVPTELAAKGGEEWRDVEIGQLALVGHPLTVEPSRVQARPPSPTEREALDLHRGPSVAVVGYRYHVQVAKKTVPAGVVVLARGDRVFVERDSPEPRHAT